VVATADYSAPPRHFPAVAALRRHGGALSGEESRLPLRLVHRTRFDNLSGVLAHEHHQESGVIALPHAADDTFVFARADLPRQRCDVPTDFAQLLLEAVRRGALLLEHVFALLNTRDEHVATLVEVFFGEVDRERLPFHGQVLLTAMRSASACD
jgi:hypothetical protein